MGALYQDRLADWPSVVTWLTRWNKAVARVEAGSNTPTVTLRVVGGDKKGSLKYETVIYGREYQGTRTRERLRWQEPAAYTKDRPILSSERAPHKKEDRNCQKIINIWSRARDGARYQNLLTDWPSVAMWLWLWLGGIRCSKGTPIIKKPTLPFYQRRNNERKKSIDTEQIYGYGSQRGSMPGVTVLAGCRQ
jgi:hypothetical protein